MIFDVKVRTIQNISNQKSSILVRKSPMQFIWLYHKQPCLFVYTTWVFVIHSYSVKIWKKVIFVRCGYYWRKVWL